MRQRWLVLALVAACGKGGGATATGDVGRAKLFEAWKMAGLDVSAFAAAQSSVGKDCTAGTVNKVDVLVCSFASPDEAKAVVQLGYEWVGDTTGSSQAKGAFVIAAADRHKADPNGKTINQIFKLAPN